jgi:hypothetical protein
VNVLLLLLLLLLLLRQAAPLALALALDLCLGARFDRHAQYLAVVGLLLECMTALAPIIGPFVDDGPSA